MATSRLCSILDCGKSLRARGWCGSHYQRWQKYGDPLGEKTPHHTTLCSIPDCGKRMHCRGWCQTHYDRWRANGDPLVSKKKTLRGTAMAYYRDVVIPYGGDECLIWPFYRNRSGYGVIGFCKNTRLVTRLVCEEVHGRPEDADLMAAHSCNNGHLGCVTPRHLRWATRRENDNDRLAAGNCARRLYAEDVRRIFAMRPTTSVEQLAAMHRVGTNLIYRVLRGEYVPRASDAPPQPVPSDSPFAPSPIRLSQFPYNALAEVSGPPPSENTPG